MPQLIRPNEVKTTVVTKEGECRLAITLDLNIHIDTNGAVSVAATAKEKEAEKKDDVQWAIPDFKSSNKEKIQFGKQE